MTDQKIIKAALLAGFRTAFPFSAHEPSLAYKFQRLWPSTQREMLKRVEELEEADDQSRRTPNQISKGGIVHD